MAFGRSHAVGRDFKGAAGQVKRGSGEGEPIRALVRVRRAF
jgi:hypothetical protein